ncbi:MAG: hypothetical protein ACOC22_03455 [bacterium]
MTEEHIGYIAAINYTQSTSSGYLQTIEWTLGKDGLTSYRDNNTKIFKTASAAYKHLKKYFADDPRGYVRKYYKIINSSKK